MKKNLRNLLVLGLGLMTTVSFAQDWDVDSRTRIDMSGDYDRMETNQRTIIGTTWGGSDWGIHLSTEANVDLGLSGNVHLNLVEAYASTDLMGYASLTVGRQALSYGSGNLIGVNDWGSRVGQTRDAMVFGVDNDMADLTLMYASRYNGDSLTSGGSAWAINAAKEDGDWNVNVLYGSQSVTVLDEDGDAETFMGLDAGYDLMGGALSLGLSYNTYSWDDGESVDEDMMSLSATYSVNDDMSVSVTRSAYGEEGFYVDGGSMAVYGTESWATHGNMGHLGANQVGLSVGADYNMGDFNISAGVHRVSDETEDAEGSTMYADYERSAMNLNLGYTLSDNANVSLMYATDDYGTDTDSKYMYVTINIRP